MKKLFFPAALFCLIVLNAFLAITWIKKDTAPTAWDESIHTLAAYDYQQRAVNGPILSLLDPAYFNYPPLYHYMVAACLGRVGSAADTGGIVNVLGFSILIIIIFLLGVELLGPWEGLIASLLFISYPTSRYLQHLTILDPWLTVNVATALYCLIRSDSFAKLKWSIGFGLVLGMGMITKWTAPAALLLPAMFYGLTAIKQKRWVALIGAAASIILIAGPWYAVNMITTFSHASGYAKQTPAGGVVWSGWKNIFWYAVSLYRQMGWSVFLLIPGIFVAMFWKTKTRPLMWCLVSAYITFSLINNKNDRYLMPALPAAALLSVAWVPLRQRWAQILMLSLGLLFLFKSDSTPPVVQDWKHREVIETIQQLKINPGKVSRVTVVSNAPYFHSSSFNVDLKERGISTIEFRGVPKNRWFEFSEFILTKTGDTGPWVSKGSIAEPVAFVRDPAPWFRQVYVQKGTWSLPDGSQAFLYQQNPRSQKVPDVGLFNLSLENFQVPHVVAKDVELRAVPFSRDKTALGFLRELSVKSKSLDYRGVQLENVHVILSQPQVNLPLYLETNEIQLLSLERLKINATLNKDALIGLMAQKAKWLRNPTVEYNENVLTVRGSVNDRMPIEILLLITIKDSVLQTELKRIAIFGIPLPRVFFRALVNRNIPLSPSGTMPYYLDISELNGEKGLIKIISR
jgi:hypothetical protein